MWHWDTEFLVQCVVPTNIYYNAALTQYYICQCQQDQVRGWLALKINIATDDLGPNCD